MTMLFCDSFDHYTTPTQKWDALSGDNGSATITSGAARTGISGLSLGGNTQGKAIFKNIPARNVIICGFAMNVQNTGIPFFWDCSDATNEQVSLRIGTGSLQFYRASSVAIGPASSIVVPSNTFVYVEVKVLISATVGTVECRINGVSAIPSTGSLNTQGSGSTNITQFGLRGPGSNAWFFDDVYCVDTNGAVNNSFLGNTSIKCVLPSANGTTNNWTQTWASWTANTVMSVGQQIKDSNNNVQQVQSVTSDAKTGALVPTWATTGGVTTTDNHVTWVVVGTGANPGAVNWMAVSEIPPDDLQSYLKDSTVGDIDRYTFPPISANTISAVAVNLRAEEDVAGTRAFRAACKSGATLADSGTDLTLNTSFTDYQGFFETDPNTAAAWTATNVNAAEFGEKLTV